MRKNFIFLSLFLILGLLTSCESSKLEKDAKKKAENFFKFLKNGDEKSLADEYNGFTNFESFYKSDSSFVKSSKYEDEVVVVTVHNKFTNGLGKLNERDISLIFKKDSLGKLQIFDSKGLTDFSEKSEFKFASKSGCLTKSDTTDQQIFKSLKKAEKVMLDKALEVYLELKKDVRVSDWNWETLYSGSVSGQGIVVNNSRFSIPSLKYSITYKTSSGRVITKDQGNVSYNPIPAGGSTSFSFYTDYVGNANTASIELEFDDELIYNYLAEKNWTGKECEEYYKLHPEETKKLGH